MAQVQVRDFALWIKHIHGDEVLAAKLDRLRPDEVVRLKVDGRIGTWRKMSAYKSSGRPTPGLAPLGEMRAYWKELFKQSKGDAVATVELVADEAVAVAGIDAVPAIEWPDEANRIAALAALRDFRNAGYKSDGASYGKRDDWYTEDGR
ncbi:hypothetical protein [Pleomorphomonas sp. JP5]|uniref:hypothetical protein n=1 Tax=Pleomorphomonas sp. JP5 TaxID=2942998 RepID=UPI0020442800|nr:hypothetical protein [Pleomorphomonas sp. JP5]MCM5557183.1 hypothetical protein [Pleomorphomonas sp. JP5]